MQFLNYCFLYQRNINPIVILHIGICLSFSVEKNSLHFYVEAIDSGKYFHVNFYIYSLQFWFYKSIMKNIGIQQVGWPILKLLDTLNNYWNLWLLSIPSLLRFAHLYFPSKGDLGPCDFRKDKPQGPSCVLLLSPNLSHLTHLLRPHISCCSLLHEVAFMLQKI